MKTSRIFATIAALALPVQTAHAQGSVLSGRVMSDSGMALVGAEVVLDGPGNTTRTGANGDFRFSGVLAGEHVLGVRMPGYAPHVDTIEVADAGEVRREYRLARIEATLPEVPVTATLLDRKLSEFHERRRMGIGRFLDSAEFANARGTRTSDRLSRLPGLTIARGRFLSDAYVVSTRVQGSSRCRAAIWLDGVNLRTDFSVNQLDPSMIAAVEWYAGQASIPAKYNVTPSSPRQAYCGVLVIWLR
jgi:hypothetical protein